MKLHEDALRCWGERIGRVIDTPAVVALSGALGAGKSVLARAIGRGAGVVGPMPSPSFNLLLRYTTGSGKGVVHVDLYRIGDPDELWELGWSELAAPGEIVLVEWPEKAGPHMPADHWLIRLSVPRTDRALRDVEVVKVGEPPELPGFPMTVESRP